MKKLLILLVGFMFLQSCEIDDTEVSDRTNYLGKWTCNEIEGEFAPTSYPITIESYGSGNSIRIRGLYNQGNNFSVEAGVSGRSLFIDQQTINGITISGSGVLSGNLNLLTLNFIANDGSGNDNVKAECYR